MGTLVLPTVKNLDHCVRLLPHVQYPRPAAKSSSITAKIGHRPMVKVIWRDSEPSDPMYSEGYQSYSPHWARAFRKSRKPSPSATVGHPTAHDRRLGKRTRPIKPGKLYSPTR
jgi:hypothetical protein